jgi:hypothetical protein
MSLHDQQVAAQKAGKEQRLTTERWKWEIDKELLGVFMSKDLIKSTKRELPDFYTYTFVTDEGPFAVLFSTAFDKSAGADLQEGVLYSVTYKGKVNLSKGRTMHVYVVKSYGPVSDIVPAEDKEA